MLKFIPKIINKFEFRFVFYILSILLIWKFALIPFKQFNAFETIAPLQVFDQKKDATKFENFNFVEAGLDLQKFGFYDARKYHFEVNGLVWFKFDPKLVSVDEIGKFFFDKVVKETRGRSLSLSIPPAMAAAISMIFLRSFPPVTPNAQCLVVLVR